MLAVSSLATYGILLAGWSANSKYAFLGSLKKYSSINKLWLILSSAILLVVMLTGSLNLTVNVEAQRASLIYNTFISYIYYIFYRIGSRN